jgi:hypothetical protein
MREGLRDTVAGKLQELRSSARGVICGPAAAAAIATMLLKVINSRPANP